MTVRYDVRLSRAEGYRKLGMYADACWELEEQEGDDRLSDPVLVCRWKIYRDSENLLGEKAMAAEMVRRFSADWEWRLRTARAVRRYEDAETALITAARARSSGDIGGPMRSSAAETSVTPAEKV